MSLNGSRIQGGFSNEHAHAPNMFRPTIFAPDATLRIHGVYFFLSCWYTSPGQQLSLTSEDVVKDTESGPQGRHIISCKQLVFCCIAADQISNRRYCNIQRMHRQKAHARLAMHSGLVIHFRQCQEACSALLEFVQQIVGGDMCK